MHNDATSPPVLPASSRKNNFLSEREFSDAVLSSSRDGLFAFNTDCRFTVWNPEMERIFGLSNEAVLGHDAFDVCPFLKESGEDRSFLDVLDGKTSSTEGVYTVPETGRKVFFEIAYSPLRNKGGEIVGGLGVVRDVTEQRRQQQAHCWLAAEHRIARVLSESLSLDEAAAEILSTLCEATDGVFGEIWLLDSDREHLSYTATWRREKSPVLTSFVKASREMTFSAGKGLPGRVWVDRKTNFILDLEKDTTFIRREQALKAGLRSCVAFPIATGNQFFGVILCFRHDKYEADEDLLESLSAVGGDIAQFMRRRQSEVEVRHLNQQLEHWLKENNEVEKSQARAQLFKSALASLSHELNSAKTPREAATAIFETADELFGWDACTLHLFSGNTVRTVLNIDTIDGKRKEVVTENDGQLTRRMRKVLQDGPQLVLRKEGTATDSMMFGDITHVSASIMVVPIREAKKTLGMLSVQSYTPNAYDSEKLRTLQTLANYCGGAMERIRATEQLLLRENQLRVITDSLPVLISFVDKDRRYRFNNRAYESWFGLSPESLFGKAVVDIVSDETLREIDLFIEEALKGETVSFDRWVAHKSLGPRYTHALYVPVVSNSAVEGFIHLSTDITERKQTEDRLHLLSEGTKILSSTLHPNEMLKKLASLSVPTLADYCFFDVVEGNHIKRAACEHVHGEKKSWFFNNVKFLPTNDCAEHPVIKVIRSRKPQLITDITDEWLRRIATSREHLQFMRNLNCCSTMTLPVIFGDRILGALTFCFAESKRRHSEADCKLGEEIARRVAIALNNAELFETITNEHAKAQASEAYFRDLAEAIPHMVWTTNPEGVFEFCNRRWCEYTGQTREGSQGLGWVAAIHSSHAERVAEAWKKSLSTGEVYEVEYPLRAADGTYRWHLDRALPLRNKDGKIVKWFGTCTDVHEKIKAEELVSKMNQELERRVSERTVALKEINDQMESFCYSVSHDLRAPLRAMRAFTQVLLDDYAPKLDHAGQDFLNRVGDAAERMDRLIQDLLEYSRLGRMEITLGPVDLENSVESVLIDLRMEIRAHKAEVEVTKPMPQVIAHETVLERILQNLITNALKFVPAGEMPKIKIWAEKIPAITDPVAEASPEMVRIHVEDSGIGIPAEYHKRIFNVFERLHGTEDYPGTGIGLAIVQKGAERMKGHTGLESAPGKGSRFWVDLPAV